MTREWVDGLSHLSIEIDPVTSQRRLVIDGRGFSAGAEVSAEIAAVLRPAVPYPTRPADYARDQYEPADDAEETNPDE